VKKISVLNIFFLFFFTANQTLAANFYFEKLNSRTNEQVISGDLSFTYSLVRSEQNAKEIFEKDNLRIYTTRKSDKISSMVVEKKTRFGFLYLKYKNSGENWENTAVTFRKYQTFFKDFSKENCATEMPATKNRNDLLAIAQNTPKQNFADLFFDKNCSDKLSTEEFNQLVAGTYNVLGDSEDALEQLLSPRIVSCVQIQNRNSALFLPFRELRNKLSLSMKSPSASPAEVKNNTLLPFPISCEFDKKNEQKCGVTQEGLKTKINLNVACLKKGSKGIKETAQEIIIHEFAHNLKQPRSFSESEILASEKGLCPQKNGAKTDIIFPNAGETDVSKNAVIAKENAKSTGANKIAGDVINPYNSFAERSATPAATQATTIAAKTSSSDTAEVSGGNTAAQQRSIASSTHQNTISGSSYSVNTNIPTFQQQAQYQNVKAYVDTSIDVVAKKIAPIVSYVESPAFAKTLPPTNFENGNGGDTSAPIDNTTTTTASTSKSTTVSRAAATTGRSGEVAAGSSLGGSGGTVASSNTVNLGSSSSGSSSRGPAAVNKNSNRLASDPGLDNAYALKVRKKLLSDNAYRTELRNKGVQIEFADGYKFETPSTKILYTEKNGVLVRGQ